LVYRVSVMTDPTSGEPAASPAAEAAAVLADGLRSRLYAFARAVRRPVTREEAADAAGISRKLAAFHLDKLARAGLLHVSYAPTGAGARGGRPPKLYQPAGLDLQVSIPPRQHDELAGILIDAVLTCEVGEDARHAALRAAATRGGTLGAAARTHTRGGQPGPERALSITRAALQQWGFEPEPSAPGCLRLRNCPFHPLAARSPELVCGMNRAFLTGFLAGLGTTAVRAVPSPTAGECCVELRTATGNPDARTAPHTMRLVDVGKHDDRDGPDARA
jgi:predicted ArsR family transcriptional regulator